MRYKRGRIKRGIEEIYWSSKAEIRDRVKEIIEYARDGDYEVEAGTHYCAVITKDSQWSGYVPEKDVYQYVVLTPYELARATVSRIMKNPFVEVGEDGHVFIWVDEKTVAEEYKKWEAEGDCSFEFMSAMYRSFEPWMFSWIIRKLGVPLPDKNVLLCLVHGEKPPKEWYKGYALGVKPPKGKRYGDQLYYESYVSYVQKIVRKAVHLLDG